MLSDVYNGYSSCLLFGAKRVTDMLSSFSRMKSVSFSHFSVFATYIVAFNVVLFRENQNKFQNKIK